MLERAEEIRLASDGLFDCVACNYSLDGIAKGFAVDRAVGCLQAAGMSGVVNAGGDLRSFGEEWEPVYVRSGSELIYLGEIRDAAVATSASLGIVHPRAGPSRAAAVTVMASDCMTADALTKPCLLAPHRAEEIAQRLGAKVLRSE